MTNTDGRDAVKVTNARRQRGGGTVYDLRALEERVLALEADRPGATVARLRQRLTNLAKERHNFSWNVTACMEYKSLDYAVAVTEVRGAA